MLNINIGLSGSVKLLPKIQIRNEWLRLFSFVTYPVFQFFKKTLNITRYVKSNIFIT
jgi:hypothetical protein